MTQSTVFTASNGEQRNPFYQGEFPGETKELAAYRRHWATAARDAEKHDSKERTSGQGGRL